VTSTFFGVGRRVSRQPNLTPPQRFEALSHLHFGGEAAAGNGVMDVRRAERAPRKAPHCVSKCLIGKAEKVAALLHHQQHLDHPRPGGEGHGFYALVEFHAAVDEAGGVDAAGGEGGEGFAEGAAAAA
jgi:hypothetical protein